MSDKDLLKLIVQWMEQGGAEPKGKNAINYPKGYRPGLERLLAFAEMLEIDELINRIKLDLGNIPRPIRYCALCKRKE